MMKNKSFFQINPLFFVTYAIIWYLCGGVMATALIASIICHEYGHVYVARVLGIDTANVRLSFYGCKAEIYGADIWGISKEIPIACAGPLLNLFIALLLGIISQVFYRWYYSIMNIAIWNLFIAGFNLLPFFPLDGGRIMRSVLCCFLPKGFGIKLCSIASIMFGSGLILFSVYCVYYGKYIIFPALIGVIVIIGSAKELRNASQYRVNIFMDREKLSSPKKVVRYAISCEDDLRKAISYFNDDCFNIVDVINNNGEIQRTMTEQELINEFLK